MLETPSPPRPTCVRYLVLVLLATAAGSAYLTRHCIAAANTTIQKDLGFTSDQMGWILAAFAGGYFVFQVPGGWLGNRFGTRGTFAAISVLWSLFAMWTALVSSFTLMLASRIWFGAAQAGLVPISVKIIKDWFPDRRRGIASAVVGASMSIGGVATMQLTGQLLQVLGWREIFLIYSLVGILWAAVYYFCFRTNPAEHPWVNQDEVDLIRTEIASGHVTVLPDGISDPDDAPSLPARPENAAADDAEPALPMRVVLRRMLGCRSLLVIWFQEVFRAAGYGILVTWFPAYLEKAYGVSVTSATLLTSAPLAAVVVGSLSGGFIVDALLSRTGSKRLSRSGTAMTALGLSGIFTLTAAWSSSPNMVVVAFTLGALFAGLGSPGVWTGTMDVAGRYTAEVMGTMNMCGTVGGFAMPVVLGYIIANIERTGGDWNRIIYVTAAVYFIASVSWLFVDPNQSATDPRNHSKAQAD